MFWDRPEAKVVILTGDVHSTWADDLALDGAGSVAADSWLRPSPPLTLRARSSR